MKILYSFQDMSGGAPRSQLSHMLLMKDKGHEVIASIGDDFDKLSNLVPDIPIYQINRFKMKALINNLLILIRWIILIKKTNPDIIHSNRVTQNKFLSIAAMLTNKAYIISQAGGIPYDHNIRTLKNYICIVYSLENKYQFLKCGFKKNNIHVISNRISFSNTKYINKKKETSILLSGNIKDTTINGILFALNLLYHYADKDIIIFIAGGDKSKDQSYTDIINEKLIMLNKKENIKAYYLGWVEDIESYEDQCDIALGKGRSILRPACKGKTSYVISEENKIIHISKDNLHQLYYYNFSGRNPHRDDSSHLINIINLKNIYTRHTNHDVIKFIKDKYDLRYAYNKLSNAYNSAIDLHKKRNFINRIFIGLLLYANIYKERLF